MPSITCCGFFSLALGLSSSGLAQEITQTCLGQAQDQYWQEVSTVLAGDQTIDRLSDYRLEICRKMAHEELEPAQALNLWERALIDAVTIQAVLQKARVHRTVLRIYGSF